MGPLHYFLGIEAHRLSFDLYLTQTKYVWDLLHRTNIQDAKPIKSPMQPGSKLSEFDGKPLPNPHDHRSVMGALQYVTLTRPYIAFAVNQVCQFIHEPQTLHWIAVKGILRFLKGSLTHGLHFRKGSFKLTAYADADRRSITGYAIFLGPNLISWNAKKQPTVFNSSIESEYRSPTLIAAELYSVRMVIKDLGIFLKIHH